MMYRLLAFAFGFFNYTQAAECPKWEVAVKQHQLMAGRPPKKTTRKAHCREIHRHSRQIVASLKSPTVSTHPQSSGALKWSDEEIETLLRAYSAVSDRFSLYFPSQIYRVRHFGSPLNPAAFDSTTKEMWLTDTFFRAPDKVRILHHEMAHLLFNKLSREQRKDFALRSGWKVKNGTPEAPLKLLLPDSAHSVSEDFANHVEWWLHDKSKVKPPSNDPVEFLEKILRDAQ